eukprot:535521-Amphidinium_carterae.1
MMTPWEAYTRTRYQPISGPSVAPARFASSCTQLQLNRNQHRESPTHAKQATNTVRGNALMNHSLHVWHNMLEKMDWKLSHEREDRKLIAMDYNATTRTSACTSQEQAADARENSAYCE